MQKTLDLGDILINEIFWYRHQIKDPTPGSDCILWAAGMHRQGYGMCGAWRKLDNKFVMTVTHRIAMRIKLGRAITRKENVIHTCANASCVNPDHLITGTHHDIQRVSREKGGRRDIQRGRYVRDNKMQNRKYKYTIEEMLFIRRSEVKDIQERFNLSKQRAGQLRYGMRKAYNWLKEYETK